jgi:hypothetical protein
MANAMDSVKHSLISKANTTIVVTTAVAGFLVVFTLVASISLVGQLKYQNHVITAKKQAVKQLKTDISATNNLVTSYKAFVSTSQNVLGGNPKGNGPTDGDNGKIILDALPSAYDFPALATSLEKLLTSQNVKIQSIAGTDDEVAQSGSTSATPTPVAIPVQFTVTGDYQSIQGVVNVLEHSIRPFQVQTMDVTGDQGSLTLTITAQTYYQPAKNLQITSKVVK